MQIRADRAIVKRQAQELVHEKFVSDEVERFKVECKGHWENKSADVIRKNRVKGKAAALEAQHKASLQERRKQLAEKLSAEQRAYEKEMVDREETPQQRMDKMANKALDLKKRREDERKAVVQQKLYQQWRTGIDDMRAMDGKIIQLKTISDRDFQLDEKAAQAEEEAAYHKFYDDLWKEGYAAKIEREEREKQMKKDRETLQVKTLAIQTKMKQDRIEEEKVKEKAEAEAMAKLWAAEVQEAAEAKVRVVVAAFNERKNADSYMNIQQRQRAAEVAAEKEFDKNFVAAVLERERKITETEEAEKALAKKQTKEFTEALKKDMARKAESDAELERLQAEEMERQWQKRYVQWEKEELARRSLMEDVYADRAEQVKFKAKQREEALAAHFAEKELVDVESHRMEHLEKQRAEAELEIARQHQEELFKQMDFRQVQKHRQLQHHAIEQRQAAIAEEKIRRAVAHEKVTSNQIMADIMANRETQRPKSIVPPTVGYSGKKPMRPPAAPVAPWDK